jgi:hypothetical protein
MPLYGAANGNFSSKERCHNQTVPLPWRWSIAGPERVTGAGSVCGAVVRRSGPLRIESLSVSNRVYGWDYHRPGLGNYR